MKRLDNVKRMYVISFLTHLHFFGGVLVPMLTEWGNITFSQVMALQSWFMVVNALVEVPTGVVADKYGRKTSLLLGLFISLIGFIVYVSKSNIYLFVLGEFLCAIGFSLVSGADDALIYDSLLATEQSHLSDQVFGRYNSLRMAAMIIASPVGSWVGARFGLSIPMWITAIPLLIAIVICMGLKEPSLYSKEDVSRQIIKQLLRGYHRIKSDSKLRAIVLNFSIVVVAGRAMIWLYQPLLQVLGLRLVGFGLVHAVSVLIEVIIMVNVDRINSLIGNRGKALNLSWLLAALGFFFAVVATLLPVSWIARSIAVVSIWLVIGLGLSRKPFFDGPINKLVPSEERATVASTVRMISTLGSIVVNPLLGAGVEFSLTWTLMVLGIALATWRFTQPLSEDVF